MVFQDRMGDSVRIDAAAQGEVDFEILLIGGRGRKDLVICAFRISSIGMADMLRLSFRYLLRRAP